MPSFVRSKLSNSPLLQQQANQARPASIGLVLSQVRAVLNEYGGVSDEGERRAEEGEESTYRELHVQRFPKRLKNRDHITINQLQQQADTI